MANFSFKSEIIHLEKDVGFMEVFDLPLNLSQKVGEGALGIVYKHKLKDTITAVKMFKCDINKLKLLKTCKQLKALKNKYIVRFHGYSIRPAALFFEYCSISLNGDLVTNLSQMLSIFNENEYFSFTERMDYIQQAAKGLSYLHNKEIIHRDFKPSNLLVSGSVENITIKVADFDCITILKETLTATKTCVINTIGMTISYIAPELVSRKVKKPTKESDIYAWALSAFEILSAYSNPWKDVIPILNDHLLSKAILDGTQPSFTSLEYIYQNERDLFNKLATIIEKSWNLKIELRPDIDQVCNYNYATLILY